MKALKSLSTLFLLASSTAALADVTTIATLPNAFNDAISVDKSGQLFISNAGRFSPVGLNGTDVYAADTTNGHVEITLSGLNGPLGNVFDERGDLYVSNYNTGDIYRKDKHGSVELFATIDGGGGLAIDNNNELYAASFQGGKIYKIDHMGNATVFADDPILAGGPVGISFDEHHNLYVGMYYGGKIAKISKKGEVTEVATLSIAGNHIAYLVYAAGNIYTTSLNTNKVYKVALDGTVEEFAGNGALGNTDGPNEQATFLRPNGIGTNKAQDTLYISEYWSPYIRAINLD